MRVAIPLLAVLAMCASNCIVFREIEDIDPKVSSDAGDSSTDSSCPVDAQSCPLSCTANGCVTVEEIAAGDGLSCARLSDGSVACWGIGDSKPKPVPDLANVKQLAVGGGTACAVLADGSARCWGDGHDGELGDGTQTPSVSVPTKVTELGSVRQITVGHNNHACALLNDSTVRCWGQNGYGQLGDGTTADRLVPAHVVELTDVAEVSAGFGHTCARHTTGKVSCWGRLSSGADRASSTKPVAWGNGVSVATIRAGAGSTCAVLIDRTVACSTTLESSAPPVQVPGLADIQALELSSGHACALDQIGRIWCWGLNLYGELGDGTFIERANPVRANFTAARSLAVGNNYTLVNAFGTRVMGWGLNDRGQLGIGKNTPNELNPVAVVW